MISSADELRAAATRVASSTSVVRHATLRRRIDETTIALIDQCQRDALALVDKVFSLGVVFFFV